MHRNSSNKRKRAAKSTWLPKDSRLVNPKRAEIKRLMRAKRWPSSDRFCFVLTIPAFTGLLLTIYSGWH